MKFIVTCGLKNEKKGGKILEWEPLSIEARDKWEALVKAAEALGIEKKVSMRDLWKGSSIKLDPVEVKRERLFRKE